MTAAITLDHIQKSFNGHQVLKDVSFSIEPGTIVGYIGQNGAGKSTTVKIILGLLTQDAGQISLQGRILDPDDDSYKQHIGYVPEAADVFDALTAREYLTLIGQLYGMTDTAAGQKAEALAEIVGLGQAFDRRITSYSKGMRQMVLIIASLLHDPDILFWDEPLNGLDANSVLVVEEILQELRNRGKTIFYSSIAANADTNLQQLFNDLTGFAEHGEKAKAFVDIVTEAADHE